LYRSIYHLGGLCVGLANRKDFQQAGRRHDLEVVQKVGLLFYAPRDFS
jgi:hypothetical protein